MKQSYFYLSSVFLDYTIYVAFSGDVSVEDVVENDIAWTVICRLTTLSRNSFIVYKCTKKNYSNGLVKIDFTFK